MRKQHQDSKATLLAMWLVTMMLSVVLYVVQQ